MRYRYKISLSNWSTVSLPVWNDLATSDDYLINLELDDKQATGDDFYEILGRKCHVTLSYYQNSIQELINHAHTADASWSKYSDFVFQITRETLDENEAVSRTDILFTGLLLMETINLLLPEETLEFDLCDALWVWINRANENNIDYGENNYPIFMQFTHDDESNINLHYFSDTMIYNRIGLPYMFAMPFKEYDENATIILSDRPYVMPFSFNKPSEWMIYSHGHPYTLVAMGHRIYYCNDDHTRVRCFILGIFTYHVSGNLYNAGAKWLVFEVNTNAMSLPVNASYNSVVYGAEAYNTVMGLLFNYLHDNDIIDDDTYCTDNGQGILVPVIDSTSEFVINETKKIAWNSDDEFWHYWTPGKFDEFSVTGIHKAGEIVKGMLCANNLTMYANNFGDIIVKSRVPFWLNTPPIFTLTDETLITRKSEGLYYDLSKLLDSLDIFIGTETITDALLDFYRSITATFNTILTVSFDPIMAGLTNVLASGDILLAKIIVNDKEYYILSYTDAMLNDIVTMKAIGSLL